MPYCLPLRRTPNTEDRSVRACLGFDLSSLICIPYFYGILELILELIYCCKQNPDKSHLFEVRFIRSGIQILVLRIIESILAYHYFLDIQETILKPIHLK